MAHIVIVDDDELVTAVATEALVAAGHSVTAVHDGDEAIAAISDPPADLVILDQALPGKSGMQILSELRAMPGMIDLPIMMLTKRGTRLHIELADNEGADDYITKPFDSARLVERAQALLVGAGISRAARANDAADDDADLSDTSPPSDDPLSPDDHATPKAE